MIFGHPYYVPSSLFRVCGSRCRRSIQCAMQVKARSCIQLHKMCGAERFPEALSCMHSRWSFQCGLSPHFSPEAKAMWLPRCNTRWSFHSLRQSSTALSQILEGFHSSVRDQSIVLSTLTTTSRHWLQGICQRIYVPSDTGVRGLIRKMTISTVYRSYMQGHADLAAGDSHIRLPYDDRFD